MLKPLLYENWIRIFFSFPLTMVKNSKSIVWTTKNNDFTVQLCWISTTKLLLYDSVIYPSVFHTDLRRLYHYLFPNNDNSTPWACLTARHGHITWLTLYGWKNTVKLVLFCTLFFSSNRHVTYKQTTYVMALFQTIHRTSFHVPTKPSITFSYTGQCNFRRGYQQLRPLLVRKNTINMTLVNV